MGEQVWSVKRERWGGRVTGSDELGYTFEQVIHHPPSLTRRFHLKHYSSSSSRLNLIPTSAATCTVYDWVGDPEMYWVKGATG